MTEVLFINGDYIKKYSPINGSVEEAYMVSSIYLAQDKWVQPLIGSALLEKLKADVVAGSLSGLYLTLMNDYLRKCLLWYSVYEMLPNMYVKIDNGSLVIRTSDNATTITEQDLEREMSRALANGNFYADRMKYFLCNNTIDEYLQEGNINAQPRRPLDNMTVV